jgi:hypothetical protein
LIEPIAWSRIRKASNARGVGTHPEKLRCLDGPLPADYAACTAAATPKPYLRRRALGKGMMIPSQGRGAHWILLLSAWSCLAVLHRRLGQSAGGVGRLERGNSDLNSIWPEPEIVAWVIVKQLWSPWSWTDGQSRSESDSKYAQEALMVGVRSERARARARNLLATVYPIPRDAEFYRLRELAVEYIQEAERLEREQKGGMTESDELISAALDDVARNYFARALDRSQRKQAG